MWVRAFLADILHVCCCRSTVEKGPKGLDQKAWTNGVFYAFTLLVAVFCARVSMALTA